MYKRSLKTAITILLAAVIIFLMALNTVAAGEAVDLSEAIADSGNWVTKDAEVRFSNGKAVMKTVGDAWAGLVSYKMGSKYGDKIMDFTLKQTNVSGEHCFALSIRHGDADKFLWQGTKGDGYLVWVKPNYMDMQKFAGGKQTIFLDNKLALNKANKEYRVQFGAVPEGQKTRFILKVDGATVYEYLDDGSLPIENTNITFYVMANNELTIGVPAKNQAKNETDSTSNPKTGDAGVLAYLFTSMAAGTALIVKKKRDV